MNNPVEEVPKELEWMAAMKMDFIDLTLEPPKAGAWQLDPAQVRGLLDKYGMGVVGHTAYYLPLAIPFDEVREAGVEACGRCIDVFAAVGAEWMNVHPDTDAPLHGKKFLIDKNIETLRQLVRYGRERGVSIMVENIPGNWFNSVEDLGILLGAVPELGLHLDIGHCNLSPIPHNAESILNSHSSRLRHVHLHDNKGGSEDLHLPLGAGTIDLPRVVRALKACNYDGTITLEVFSPDRHYLEYSRDVLRRLWEKE